MSYRVETASSGRAVCNSTDCKKASIKIGKDELRLGTWVDFKDRGSFMWRHWGCVTGKILENIRKKIEDPDSPGTYQWDALDGYEGEEKNSLDKHPELQAKVRRVITQGFIDPEDFRGDPEMNVLGESGLRTKESKKRMRDEKKAREKELNGDESSPSKSAVKSEATQADDSTPIKKKPAAKKRSRVKDESDDEEAETKKPAKKRATKAKKEVSEDDEDVKPPPTKKSRAKKVKSEEDTHVPDAVDDAKPAPAKKSRAKKVKAEDEADAAEDTKPAPKKPRAKKGVKKEEVEAEAVKDEPDFDAPAVVSAPKKRASRGKKAVKEEPVDEEDVEESSTSAVKAEPVKSEPAKEENHLEAPVKGKAAKQDTNATTKAKKSTRGSRSRAGPKA